MQSHEQLEQRLDDLVRGVLATAREIALAAVTEAFAVSATGREGASGRRKVDTRPGSAGPRAASRRAPRARRAGQKRPPELLKALGDKLGAAIQAKPGETMSHYAKVVGVRSSELSVPAHRLVGEGLVRAIGERSQCRYYPAVGESP